MDDNQEWQKQDEEQRMLKTLEVLRRINLRTSTTADVLFICSELGIPPEYLAEQRRAA